MSTDGQRVCLTDEQKIMIAQWILPDKNILFGRHSYSSGITNVHKRDLWIKIHEKAVAEGIPVFNVNHTREVCLFNRAINLPIS